MAQVNVWISDAEREQIRALAADAGLSVSAFVRRRVLGPQTSAPKATDLSEITERLDGHDQRFDRMAQQFARLDSTVERLIGR